MANELPKGYKERSATEMQQAHAEWRNSLQTKGMCGVEGCEGYVVHGTHAEVIELLRQHREALHPEFAKRGRKKLTAEQQRAKAMARSEWRRRKNAGED